MSFTKVTPQIRQYVSHSLHFCAGQLGRLLLSRIGHPDDKYEFLCSEVVPEDHDLERGLHCASSGQDSLVQMLVEASNRGLTCVFSDELYHEKYVDIYACSTRAVYCGRSDLIHVVPPGANIEDTTAILWDAEVANHLVGVVSRHVLPSNCLVAGEIAVGELEALAQRAVMLVFGVLDSESYLILHLASHDVADAGTPHPWAVTAVASTSTGNAVVFGCADGSIGVTKVERRHPISWLPKAESAVNAVAVNATGRSAIVAAGCSIGVYDLVQMVRLRVLRGHTLTIRCLAFLGEDWFISGGDDTILRIWPIAGDREVKELTGHSWGISAVCASHVNNTAFSSSTSGALRQWDIDRSVCRAHFGVCRSEVSALATDNHCHRIVFGSLDGDVGAYEIKKVWLALGRMHTGAVSGVALLPDSDAVLSCGWDGTLAVWYPECESLARHFAGYGCGFGGLCFAPDIRMAILAGWDGSIGIWDPNRMAFRESRSVFL